MFAILTIMDGAAHKLLAKITGITLHVTSGIGRTDFDAITLPFVLFE